MGETSEPTGQALHSLYEAHGYALLAYTRRRLDDPRDAEEAVQEILVRAWRYASTYDPARGSERGWLFGIARNVVNDRRTTQARARLKVVAEDVDQDVDDEDLERVVESTLVNEALDRLTAEHRSAIVAAYYQGKTSTQIAEESGIAPGTVKSRLYYGLRALRASLEEQGILE